MLSNKRNLIDLRHYKYFKFGMSKSKPIRTIPISIFNIQPILNSEHARESICRNSVRIFSRVNRVGGRKETKIAHLRPRHRTWSVCEKKNTLSTSLPVSGTLRGVPGFSFRACKHQPKDCRGIGAVTTFDRLSFCSSTLLRGKVRLYCLWS